MQVFQFSETSVEVAVIAHDNLDDAYAVRMDVFVREQQVPVAEELDALDTADTTTHVLARDVNSGAPLGTARLLPTQGKNGHFHIGRVAVYDHARGRKVGVALMSALEQIALEVSEGPVTIELSAQVQASGFYRKVGYSQVSDKQYLDAGILHVDMVKVISNR